MDKTVTLVVGASSGFGREAALRLLQAGQVVWAAARRLEPMADLAAAGCTLLSMDVCDEASVEQGVRTILERDGRIDVVLNNAGYGSFGPVEAVPLAEVRRQFDVNLFGMARVNNAVLPAMRSQGSGRIIMTASLASHVSTMGMGWYSATKYAIRAMAEALRMEVEPLGIRITQIEPGPVRTGFEGVAMDSLGGNRDIPDYAVTMSHFRHFMKASYASAPGPEGTVRAMVKAATARRAPRIMRTTGLARFSIFMRRLLGDRSFLALLGRVAT